VTEPDAPARPLLDETPEHYTWNRWPFLFDSMLFHIGSSFLSATTVLPVLVARLTTSTVIVGLSSGLISGAWLLPQLFVASAVTRMPRKQPIMAIAAWVGRPVYLLVALMLYLYGNSAPSVALASVLVGVAVFYAVDAVVSVPWFDVLAKSIPVRRRGRLLGLSQALGGLGGIGAGIFVRYALSENSPWPFPNNYALLFVIACVIFLLAAVALSVIREPKSAHESKAPPSVRQVVAMLPGILLHDRPFLRLVVTRLLFGFITLSNAFYILYATRVLGLSSEVAGLFVSAQVVGSLTSGLVMGVVQDRWGPLAHMRLTIGVAALPPLVALALGPLAALLGPAIIYPYLVLYFFLGVYLGAVGWPYFNWIMEYVRPDQRPLYIGMINTLGAATMFAPLLGGWLVGRFSYPAAFAASILCAAIAMVLSLPLPNTRQPR
jgi:MFS family permease